MSNHVPFGFKKVLSDDKPSLVDNVFSRVADQYDIMNDAMSLAQHRLWKSRFINMLPLRGSKNCLDMSSGSGDIAYKMYKKYIQFNLNPASIILADPNAAMLQQAKNKFINRGLLKNFKYVQTHAEKTPFSQNFFDLYTISFGLRNTTDREKTLRESFRILKPNGWFFCLEFSQPQWPGLDFFYDTYSFKFIPKLGKLIAKNRKDYEYLVESIRTFPNQKKLSEEIKKAGFINVNHVNMAGGIVAVHKGQKPL